MGGRADAAVVINDEQVGSNVVATGSGTIDLTDLTYSFYGTGVSYVDPYYGIIVLGTPTQIGDVYRGFSGPASFGTGGSTSASSNSGDILGIAASSNEIAVPQGYVSGSPLSGSETYDNATIAGLGLNLGTYVWTWGTGNESDSFTVNIGVASVPEPSSLVLAGTAALAGLGLWTRRRRG
jgi:hypothetical protein